MAEVNIGTLAAPKYVLKNGIPFDQIVCVSKTYTSADSNIEGVEKGDFVAEGWGSTSHDDMQNSRIESTAHAKAAEGLMLYSTVLFNHNDSEPIGHVVSAEAGVHEDGTPGLWVTMVISQTERNIIEKIKDKTISKFSIRGPIVSAHFEYRATGEEVPDEDVTFEMWYGMDADVILVITSYNIVEVSVVSIPANAKAEILNYYIAKSLKTAEGVIMPEKTDTLAGETVEKSTSAMDELSSLVGGIEDEELKSRLTEAMEAIEAENAEEEEEDEEEIEVEEEAETEEDSEEEVETEEVKTEVEEENEVEEEEDEAIKEDPKAETSFTRDNDILVKAMVDDMRAVIKTVNGLVEIVKNSQLETLSAEVKELSLNLKDLDEVVKHKIPIRKTITEKRGEIEPPAKRKEAQVQENVLEKSEAYTNATPALRLHSKLDAMFKKFGEGQLSPTA